MIEVRAGPLSYMQSAWATWERSFGDLRRGEEQTREALGPRARRAGDGRRRLAARLPRRRAPRPWADRGRRRATRPTAGARDRARSQGDARLARAAAPPRRIALSGVDSLTAAERRVAELAAGGMRNREIAETLFVTLKTVEVHLGRIYGKLDIKGRSQLAAPLEGSADAV